MLMCREEEEGDEGTVSASTSSAQADAASSGLADGQAGGEDNIDKEVSWRRPGGVLNTRVCSPAAARTQGGAWRVLPARLGSTSSSSSSTYQGGTVCWGLWLSADDLTLPAL